MLENVLMIGLILITLNFVYLILAAIDYGVEKLKEKGLNIEGGVLVFLFWIALAIFANIY